MWVHYITLHYITLHYITLHYSSFFGLATNTLNVRNNDIFSPRLGDAQKV